MQVMSESKHNLKILNKLMKQSQKNRVTEFIRSAATQHIRGILMHTQHRGFLTVRLKATSNLEARGTSNLSLG